MSDIVERLRAWGTGYSVHKEAAHEIEKLRAERDGLQVSLKNIAAKAADEIEKLRSERDALLNKLHERDALHTQDLLSIQAWRAANPNSTPWPPKGRLVSWLLDEMASFRAAMGEKE